MQWAKSVTHFVSFEILSAMVMKSTVFWEITPYSICFHAAFLLGVFFDPAKWR
jgi:hypothetical protein